MKKYMVLGKEELHFDFSHKFQQMQQCDAQRSKEWFIIVAAFIFGLLFMTGVSYILEKKEFESPRDSSLANNIEDSKMFVVVVAGCSISTSVSHFTFKLLEQHGVRMTNTHWEVLHPKKNHWLNSTLFPQTNLDFAMRSMKKYYRDQGYSIRVKFEPKRMDTLQDLINEDYEDSVRLVLIVRSNVLDLLACQVRDCFTGGSKGYPVDVATGNRSDLCFNRRKYPNVTTKAYLKPDTLLQNLAHRVRGQRDLRAKIEGMLGPDVYITQVTSENLWGFEFGKDKQQSILEWSKLLIAWGIHPRKDVIAKVMKDYPMRRLSSHNDTIYNFHELMQKFGDNPIVQNYVRF